MKSGLRACSLLARSPPSARHAGNAAVRPPSRRSMEGCIAGLWDAGCLPLLDRGKGNERCLNKASQNESDKKWTSLSLHSLVAWDEMKLYAEEDNVGIQRERGKGGREGETTRGKDEGNRERETILQITAVGNTNQLKVFSTLLNVSCGGARGCRVKVSIR